MAGLGSIVRTSFQVLPARCRPEFNDNSSRLPLIRPNASAIERKLFDIQYALLGQLSRRIFENASPRLKQLWKEEADQILDELQSGES